ncbi:MAG TPA: hypothetical protein VHQ47_17935 [Phycisphaerae bacterium]|jgi:hypothetical protein|nr:hypothetical protein [Phycisphaerae bacterium]
MDWIPLAPITAPDKTAAILNRQIADLQKFRADALTANPKPGKFYQGAEAIDEALRRELILRIDIAQYRNAKNAPDPANDAAIVAVRKTLDDREGHRS